VICLPIIWVNTFEPLGKLDVTQAITTPVHEEAHRLSKGEGVVNVVIAIQVENKWSIRHDGAGPHKGVHGTCFLVVVISRTLLTGNVHQHGKADVDVCGVNDVLLI
jgi:hypothetical protein